ncbi:hypothetical protein NP233_g9527 [Leucocoprinus birnbaumii]|uniref:Nephrocystin 3-like N-terminal domain-containing protein n=1 Tax=Leucocoprinus birnbaumii TaxID=56174 RepID=A0AAD5VK27_9AGAR|nr:hypothetical protein NP233_g9527 [Leucocoprinus birnbaumii]
MSYFGWRNDPRGAAREAIAQVRQQLQLLEKKEEHLRKKIGEEMNEAKSNIVSNKSAGFESQPTNGGRVFRGGPCCYPGTRKSFLDQIIGWISDDSRESHILWLCGALGVGKTAIVNLVAQWADESNLLAVSIPHASKHSLEQIIATVAYELALTSSGYAELLYDMIKNKAPLNWKSDSGSQVIDLLVPLSDLPHEPKRLVVIDGIGASHLELIKSITLLSDLPLLWLISSQPVREILLALYHTPNPCHYVELPYGDYPEVAQDIEHYLRQELMQSMHLRSTGGISIRQTPSLSEDDFSIILKAASNTFSYAEGFLQFIRIYSSEPNTGIKKLVDLIKSSEKESSSEYRHLFFGLDPAYRTILSQIRGRLDLAQVIILITGASATLAIQEIASFMGLPSEEIDSLVGQLHPVLHFTPSKHRVGQPTVGLSHKFLIDYLDDSSRSLKLSVDHRVIYPRLTRACLSSIRQNQSLLALGAQMTPYVEILHRVTLFSISSIWQFFPKLPEILPAQQLMSELVTTLGVLQRFSGRIPVRDFIRFIYWAKDIKPNLVRTSCTSAVDFMLIEACHTIAEPLSLFETSTLGYLSLSDAPRYVLLGHSQDPVLVILINEGITIYSVKDL